MRKLMRAASVAAVAATAALSIYAGVAQARRLSSSSISFRNTWEQMTFTGGVNVVRCEVTMEGTFHERDITKVALTLVGLTTRAAAQACVGGGVTFLTETLPWHVQYISFTGTLPIIRWVNFALIGLRFRVQPTGQAACLATTSASEPSSYSMALEAGSEVIEVFWNSTFQIPLGLCAWSARVRLSESGSVTVLGGVSRIRVSLI